MNAVTDPDYADEATGAESSSNEGEDTGPESSNDETRIGTRFQVMKKRKWLLLLRVLDVLAVGEGGNRRGRVGWMR